METATQFDAKTWLIHQSQRTDWHRGNCPKQWEFKHVKGERPPGTKSTSKGQLFEFLCTADTSADKIDIPTKRDGSPTIDYTRASQLATQFDTFCMNAGIKVIDTQKVVIDEKNRWEGTIDLLADWNGEEWIIDLKYTDMARERWLSPWNEFGINFDKEGFNWSVEQAKHYLACYHAMTGRWAKYGIWVWSDYGMASNPDKLIGWTEFFRVSVTGETMALYADELDRFRSVVDDAAAEGFPAHPGNRCFDCPFINQCDDRAKFPEIKTIELNQL